MQQLNFKLQDIRIASVEVVRGCVVENRSSVVDSMGSLNNRGSVVDNWGNWGSWDNWVNEAILVQVLRESLQVDVCVAAGRSNQVSDQGGQGSGLGGSQGHGEEGTQYDLNEMQ